jgi:hypothetical protein
MNNMSIVKSVALTVDTNIYADLDQLTAAKEITNVFEDVKGTGTLMSLILTDKDQQNAALEVLFFSEEPTITSSVNGKLAIADTEMASKYLGKVVLAAANYVNLNAGSTVEVANIGMILQCDKLGSKSVWVVLRSKGTPTYTNAASLNMRIGVVQD